MEKGLERSYVARHPIKTLILITIVLAVLSGALIFTVVGSIIGLPLMVLAFITGFAAWFKFRQHWHPRR
jgi:hypothetical protein